MFYCFEFDVLSVFVVQDLIMVMQCGRTGKTYAYVPVYLYRGHVILSAFTSMSHG